jgi:hypothetical protein
MSVHNSVHNSAPEIDVPEPEAPQTDPAADVAREQVESPPVTGTPERKRVPRFGAQPNIILRRAPGLRTINWHDHDNRVFCDVYPAYTGDGVQIVLTARDADGNPTGQAHATGPTVRDAYAAACRNLRLSKHDKAELLRQNAILRHIFDVMLEQAQEEVHATWNAATADKIARWLEHGKAYQERRRALLTARRRGQELARLRAQNAQITGDTAALVLAHESAPPDLVAELAAARKEMTLWKQRAEASAASYRELSKRISPAEQDHTVEVPV